MSWIEAVWGGIATIFFFSLSLASASAIAALAAWKCSELYTLIQKGMNDKRAIHRDEIAADEEVSRLWTANQGRRDLLLR